MLGAAAAGCGMAGAGGRRGLLWGLSSRCCLSAGLWTGLGFGSRLGPRCGDGFEWLPGGGRRFGPGCGRGVRRSLLPSRLAVVGAPAVGTGLGARLGDFARSFGGGVLDEYLVVELDEVVVVVDVVESEAEETDVGDSGGSQTAGAAAGCWVLWAMRTRVRVRPSDVCACFPWCPVCLPVPVFRVVSCVVRGGVLELSQRRGQVGYPGASTSAPGRVGAGGIRGYQRGIAGCWACPLL